MNISRAALCFCLAGACGLLGPLGIQMLASEDFLGFHAGEYVWHNTLLDLWALCLLVNLSAAIWYRHVLFLFTSQCVAGIFILLKCIFIAPVDDSKLICLIYLATFTTLPSCIFLVYRLNHGETEDEGEDDAAAERHKVSQDQSVRLLGLEEEAEEGLHSEDAAEEEEEKQKKKAKEHASFNRLVALGTLC